MTDDRMHNRRSSDVSALLVDVVLDFLHAAGAALRDSRAPDRELFARAEIESAVMWIAEPLSSVLAAGGTNPEVANSVRETSARVAATVVAAASLLAATEETFDSTMGDVTAASSPARSSGSSGDIYAPDP